MARREGRFLKVDAHPMNGRSEEMVSMSPLLDDSVERLLETNPLSSLFESLPVVPSIGLPIPIYSIPP